MITVIIDYNMDQIIINRNNEKEIGIPITGSMIQMEKLIYELINALMNVSHVVLVKRDEDTETTIEEW
jgi:hypothetical protein